MVKILLDDAVEEMLFNDEARGLSKNTIDKHRKYLGMFTRFLNSIQINYIDEVEPRNIKTGSIISVVGKSTMEIMEPF